MQQLKIVIFALIHVTSLCIFIRSTNIQSEDHLPITGNYEFWGVGKCKPLTDNEVQYFDRARRQTHMKNIPLFICRLYNPFKASCCIEDENDNSWTIFIGTYALLSDCYHELGHIHFRTFCKTNGYDTKNTSSRFAALETLSQQEEFNWLNRLQVFLKKGIQTIFHEPFYHSLIELLKIPLSNIFLLQNTCFHSQILWCRTLEEIYSDLFASKYLYDNNQLDDLFDFAVICAMQFDYESYTAGYPTGLERFLYMIGYVADRGLSQETIHKLLIQAYERWYQRQLIIRNWELKPHNSEILLRDLLACKQNLQNTCLARYIVTQRILNFWHSGSEDTFEPLNEQGDRIAECISEPYLPTSNKNSIF